MKNLVEIMKNRKSIRAFTGEGVKEEDLKMILDLTLNMLNSTNLQQLSFLVVRDKEKINELSVLVGNQKQVATADVFVIFLGDYAKYIKALEEKNVEVNANLDNSIIITNMYTDVGIAVATLDYLSNSLGYGGTIIGGVSQNPVKIAELFNLPKNVYPLLGLTIGVPTEQALNATIKPKIDSIHYDEYNLEKATKDVLNYDKDLETFFSNINLKMPLHTEIISSYLNSLKEETQKENFSKLGFKK